MSELTPEELSPFEGMMPTRWERVQLCFVRERVTIDTGSDSIIYYKIMRGVVYIVGSRGIPDGDK